MNPVLQELLSAPHVEIECQTPDCGAVWYVAEAEFDPDDPEFLVCDACLCDSGEPS